MAGNEVYEQVTAQVIERLKDGVVPWHQPWKNSSFGLPTNFVSKRSYRGINILLLWSTGCDKQFWATYKQWASIDAQVRKGEKGTEVVLWKTYLYREDENGQHHVVKDSEYAALTDKSGVQRRFYLHTFKVFNIAQVDNVQLPLEVEPAPIKERLHHCNTLALGYVTEGGPKLTNQGHSGAYYTPATDTVKVPVMKDFESEEAYYTTLFHELVHSTGHESRLARDIKNGFGTDPYAQEELVAEMGAAFLSAFTGIHDRTLDASASYIKGWMASLSEDPKLVVYAAAKAQKAAEWVTGERRAKAQDEAA
jgi:antirestriction protein ArdC